VIALVEGLWQRIAVLEERVEGLENQCRKNSCNSRKPPSSDGFKRERKADAAKVSATVVDKLGI
jgi:transposase